MEPRSLLTAITFLRERREIARLTCGAANHRLDLDADAGVAPLGLTSGPAESLSSSMSYDA